MNKTPSLHAHPRKPLDFHKQLHFSTYMPFIPWIENPAFPALFFFFQKIKNAVNWTVEPGQKRLNLARIGYIDIKRYFRAIYLHK
jgi:hypothetical protein